MDHHAVRYARRGYFSMLVLMKRGSSLAPIACQINPSARLSNDIRRVWCNPPTPPARPKLTAPNCQVELGETTCIVLFAAQPRLWLLYCVQSAVRISAATLVRQGQRSRTDRKSASKRNSARKANSQDADSRPETSADSPLTPPWPLVLRECEN